MWTVGAALGQGSGPSSASQALRSCGQAPSPGSQSSKSGPGESGLQALRLAFGISVSELQGSEAIPDKLRSQIFWLLYSWLHSKLQMPPPHVMKDLGLWQRPESQPLGRNGGLGQRERSLSKKRGKRFLGP